MKMIKLEDIPLPHLSDGTIIIHLSDKNITNKILIKCEELGWLWGGSIEKKPTETLMDFNSGRYYLCMGVNSRKDRLFWSSTAFRKATGKEYTLVGDQDNSSLKIDLKTANTSPSAANCASCGGKLKDPGMGPTYKHCPKCEP